MSINQRLKNYFVHKQLNQVQVSVTTGLSKQTISNIWNDKFSTGGDTIQTICKAYETLNPAWVILNLGPMELAGQPKDDRFIEEIIIDHEKQIKEIKDRLNKLISSDKQQETKAVITAYNKTNPNISQVIETNPKKKTEKRKS